VRVGRQQFGRQLFSQLADLTLYVIDVADGDKVPRKGGPGITQSDLLIVNKVDLAEAVGADLHVMRRDADRTRGNGQGPTVFAAVKHGTGMEEIRAFILNHYQRAMELSESTNTK
jgi:urease accessory protein